jgi:hypothetical protein
MEITINELEFTSEDVNAWRAFLQTRTGQRLLPKLLESAPVLIPGGETNRIMIRSGELLGFQAAVQGLLALANPLAEQKDASNFPDLTDDDAWNDGKQVNS